MSGADFASVDFVIVEIFTAQHAIFVTDQAVFGDYVWVEFDLDLHVFGNGLQC